MGKALVLAEKPSVGKEIGRVLSCAPKGNGYMEGARYLVTWAMGHLVELADPQDYDKRLEAWQMEDLPMLPESMKLKVIPQTARQFRLVKELMERKDVDEIIIATDAGREGELVARWIIKKAHVKKAMKRLWISSQTDKAIRDGFAHLASAKRYEDLYQSAVCRAEADWLVGLNVTRALTCRYQAQLSAGRVQTPTLAMIVEKEEEIKRFRPKEYHTIALRLKEFQMEYRRNGQSALFDKEEVQRLTALFQKKKLRITKVEKTKKRELPPQLYDLTELQRDANKRYGFSAKQTLNLMQSLYETHKLLTYPRTDSRYLSEDIVPTLKERLQAISIDVYEPFAQAVLKKGISVGKQVVDDQKVSDHHAIIPTEEYVELHRLSGDERRIYDLVLRRFLAVLSEVCEYEKTRVEGVIEGHTFFASGRRMLKEGWRALYQKEDRFAEEEEEESHQTLPPLAKGQEHAVCEVVCKAHLTKAPERYSEATLLSAMEHPSRFVSSAKMKHILEDTNGIGTVATRADIIEKLLKSNYIEKRGNYLYPLSKGIQLVELVPQELRSPLLTAKWEDRLADISVGKADPRLFMKEIRTYAGALVEDVKQSEASYRHDNMTQKKCPLCGSHLLEVNGKRGKLLSCSNPACHHKQNLYFLSNARCPNCHKKLKVTGEKEKRLYTCTCGFREKFDRFNEKLKANSKRADKGALRAYMKKEEAQAKQEKSAFQLAWEEAQRKQGK